MIFYVMVGPARPIVLPSVDSYSLSSLALVSQNNEYLL